MKLDITEDGEMIAEEVFNPFIFRTEEGLDMAVCMRDDGYEIAIHNSKCKSSEVKTYKVTQDMIQEF